LLLLTMSVSFGRRKGDASAIAAHEASVARVATWKNTVQSNRRARLEAAKVKAEVAEQQRIQQDDEWHLILDAEKKQFVELAQQMQLYQTPEVRALHEKLNTARVNEERHLQQQLHAQRSDYHKRQEREYHEQMLDQLDIAAHKEEERAILKIEEARNNALQQQKQIQQKKLTEKAQIEHDSMYAIAQSKLLLENEKLASLTLAQRVKQKAEFTSGLGVAVTARREASEDARKKQQDFLENAAKHRAFVDHCEQQIKDVGKRQILGRTEMSEFVSRVTQHERNKDEQKVNSFEKKWQTIPVMHDYNQMEDQLIEQFRTHREENMETVAQQVNAHLQDKTNQKIETMQYIRERNVQLDRADAASAERMSKHEQAARLLAMDHLKMAAEKKERLSLQKTIEDVNHQAIVRALEKKEGQYQKYAESLILSEKMSGRDTRLLQDVIDSQQREGQRHKYRGVGPVEIATWDRIFGTDKSMTEVRG